MTTPVGARRGSVAHPPPRAGAPPLELEVRLLRRAIVVLVLFGLAAVFAVGANRPANPYLTPPGGTLTTTPAPR
ncbi:MAG: hypothetical protein E6G17_07200 [Actinobacteria bacterium]|nr:MAG: hypothetical protein E6G17_07200 [Actinomycetota bacterium]